MAGPVPPSGVELLFKRIRQGDPLHAFLGESPNAIKIQIWCALIAGLLVKVIKDKVEGAAKRRWAFSSITAIIRQHLGTCVDLVRFLCDPDKALIHYRPPPHGATQFRMAGASFFKLTSSARGSSLPKRKILTPDSPRTPVFSN